MYGHGLASVGCTSTASGLSLYGRLVVVLQTYCTGSVLLGMPVGYSRLRTAGRLANLLPAPTDINVS